MVQGYCGKAYDRRGRKGHTRDEDSYAKKEGKTYEELRGRPRVRRRRREVQLEPRELKRELFFVRLVAGVRLAIH